MGFYIAIFVGIWLVAVGAWWMMTNAVHSAEVDRMKNRLMGTSKGKKKKQSKNKRRKIWAKY